MDYYFDSDKPSLYLVSAKTTLDISTLSYTDAGTGFNCFIVEASAYFQYTYSTVFKFITDGEYVRIYNAACKINCTIYVLGSRANGSATENSDWDYIIEGLTNKKWKSIRNSIPGAKSIDCPIMKIDIMHTPLDETRPYIAITPYKLLNINDIHQYYNRN